jgi:hypothetical protein
MCSRRYETTCKYYLPKLKETLSIGWQCGDRDLPVLPMTCSTFPRRLRERAVMVEARTLTARVPAELGQEADAFSEQIEGPKVGIIKKALLQFLALGRTASGSTSPYSPRVNPETPLRACTIVSQNHC